MAIGHLGQWQNDKAAGRHQMVFPAFFFLNLPLPRWLLKFFPSWCVWVLRFISGKLWGKSALIYFSKLGSCQSCRRSDLFCRKWVDLDSTWLKKENVLRFSFSRDWKFLERNILAKFASLYFHGERHFLYLQLHLDCGLRSRPVIYVWPATLFQD